jgi:hypothetical protein
MLKSSAGSHSHTASTVTGVIKTSKSFQERPPYSVIVTSGIKSTVLDKVRVRPTMGTLKDNENVLNLLAAVGLAKCERVPVMFETNRLLRAEDPGPTYQPIPPAAVAQRSMLACRHDGRC